MVGSSQVPPTILQSIQLEHLPPGYILHAALFTSLSNASFLHQQLLAGNADFEYAFVDAAIISSSTHILAAAFRAVNDLIEGRLKSRNVHSEMVFCLSMNNNIATSFRTFGITPNTTHLLVLKLSTPSDSFSAAAIQSHLSQHVKGKQIPFDDDTIALYTDWLRVRKAYKLGSGSGTGSGSGSGKSRNGMKTSEDGVTVNGNENEEERIEIEMKILSAMALRGAS